MANCRTLVIVEDDPDIRDTLRTALEYEGYCVLAFENGREALDGLQKCEHPCLILLDLMMPVMDGWQFLQERRRLGDIVASIPVVVVSAVADRAQARDSGVRDYVKKPVDLDILFRVVHEHCPLAARAS